MSTEEKRQHRLTAQQWAEACALWESGAVTLSDLEARFGIAAETFSRKFTKHGIRKGAKADEHSQQVRNRVAEAALGDAVVLAKRARETKEQHYDWASALARMAMHEIAMAARNKTAVASVLPNLKAISKAMDVIKAAREERFAALGLDKGEDPNLAELPELPIVEMTAEDIEEVRRKAMDSVLGISGAILPGEADDGDGDIVIEGEGEAEGGD